MDERQPTADSLFNWYDSDGPNETRAVQVFTLEDNSPCEVDIQNEVFFGHVDSMEHAQECSNCSTLLGKRRLKPRHHCRVCNRTVCSACSPNLIQLENYKELQRACRSCVSNSLRAMKQMPSAVGRLVYLGEQLQRITNGLNGSNSIQRSLSACNDLDTAIRFCEGAIVPLENSMNKAQRMIANLQSPFPEQSELFSSSKAKEIIEKVKVFSYDDREAVEEWLEALKTKKWEAAEPQKFDRNGQEVSLEAETRLAEDKWPLTVKVKLVKEIQIEQEFHDALEEHREIKEIQIEQEHRAIKEVGIHCILEQRECEELEGQLARERTKVEGLNLQCEREYRRVRELQREGEALENQLARERAKVEGLNLQRERENRRGLELQLQYAQEQKAGQQLMHRLQTTERSWKIRCWSLITLLAIQSAYAYAKTSRRFKLSFMRCLFSKMSGRRAGALVASTASMACRSSQ